MLLLSALIFRTPRQQKRVRIIYLSSLCCDSTDASSVGARFCHLVHTKYYDKRLHHRSICAASMSWSCDSCHLTLHSSSIGRELYGDDHIHRTRRFNSVRREKNVRMAAGMPRSQMNVYGKVDSRFTAWIYFCLVFITIVVPQLLCIYVR